MKKRILFSFLCLMFYSTVSAQEKIVKLQSSDLDDVPVWGPHHEVPVVKYDEDYIAVSADTVSCIYKLLYINDLQIKR